MEIEMDTNPESGTKSKGGRESESYDKVKKTQKRFELRKLKKNCLDFLEKEKTTMCRVLGDLGKWFFSINKDYKKVQMFTKISNGDNPFDHQEMGIHEYVY